jgi:rubrerythrin
MGEKFYEIIDYAIAREQDAVEFYREMQGKSYFGAKLKLLHDLEMMEEGHVKVLKSMRKKDPAELGEKSVQNIQLSDYLVDVEPAEDMSYQDILILAIKKEETATRLYTDMASKAEDAESIKVFERLAAEEAEHKLLFEKMYDDDILTEN